MIYVNGIKEKFVDESIDELLTRKGIERRGVAVAIDGEVVPRSTWSNTPVPDHVHIEIVTAAAGG
ncbi:MAG: sulfur carrier protein ThiS [Acidimicrobiales bacterium]